MNLFLDYQNKILKHLKVLDKKKLIKLPGELKSINIELPPKDKKGHISCNVAMILSKANNTSPITIAEILKKYFLSYFSEFKDIEIAGPGFLNIYFHTSFWKKYLSKVLMMNNKYGTNKSLKKKI